MGDLIENLEEVLCRGLSKMHIATLERAAEISPFVHERTLGPDKEPWTEKAQDTSTVSVANEEDSGPASSDNVKLLDRTLNDTLSKLNATCNPSPGTKHLDFQTINKSILFREAEQQRKKATFQQVIEERSLVASRNNHQRNDSIVEPSQYLRAKKKADKEILKKAEELTNKQIQKNEKEIKDLQKQTQRQIQCISFQGVNQLQQRFRGKYELVAKLLMSIDKQSILSCVEFNQKLKELINLFDKLIATLKSGICGHNELKTAEELYRSLNQLEGNILGALNNKIDQEKQRVEAVRVQEEEQRKLDIEKSQEQEAARAQALATEAALAASVVQVPAVGAVITTEPQLNKIEESTGHSVEVNASAGFDQAKFVSSERLEFYTRINTFYHERVERVKPLQTDESMKKFRAACQKAINIPINAISSVSPQHLRDKFEKLYNFITGQPQKTNEGLFSINDHPLGRDYCLLLMAKKFVNQGDSAVSSNPQAAFPIASIIVTLWKLIPEFGHMFLAYTFKESPFLVPYFIPQKRDQTLDDYSKVLGYRVTDGQIEPQDMYLKRQTGIARLYCAVMITNGRQADGPAHPYGVDQGWRWLANFVTLEPLPDICATLILEFLQIIGHDLSIAYRQQFTKLLIYIQQVYFPKLNAIDEEGGPKARLQLILGQIPQRPQGVLPNGFW